MTKDYYKILEVSPTATVGDIKKSYRRLALKFHPDKNFGNKLSEARFKEIQEAYRVLSDDKRRMAYNNSRNHQPHKKSTTAATSPQGILTETMEFRKKVAVLDPHRMNKLALYQQIQHLLSNHNIHLLQSANDGRINKRIIEEILVCSRYLPYVHVEKICFQLAAIAGTDNHLYQKIYGFSKQVRLQTYWNKYKLLAAIIVTIIMCLAIFKLSTSLV